MAAFRTQPEVNLRSRQELPEISIAMQTLRNHPQATMMTDGIPVTEFTPQGIEVELDNERNPHPVSDGIEDTDALCGSLADDSNEMVVIDNAIYGSQLSFNDDIEIVDNAMYGTLKSIEDEATDIPDDIIYSMYIDDNDEADQYNSDTCNEEIMTSSDTDDEINESTIKGTVCK